MTKLKIDQDWVSRITSQPDDDLLVIGKHWAPMPSESELSAILSKGKVALTVTEMVRRKWLTLPKEKSAHEERGKVLQAFLRSRILTGSGDFAYGARFRRQARQRDFVEELATLAWLSHVRSVAVSMQVPKFESAKFGTKAIEHLVRMSSQQSGPRDALKYLRKLGVKVIVESPLPGMRTDGVSFVVSSSGPVIGLTLRHDRLDNFWFTLLHEIAHIVLHLRNDSTTVFIDTIEDGDDAEPEDSEVEAEADAYAKDAFVPRDAWIRSEAFRSGKEGAIVALAKKFYIHPAIVAGRLRYERRQYQAHAQLLGTGEVRSLLLAE